MPTLSISQKLKETLDALKGKMSAARKVTWSEVVEELIAFYARKDEVEKELDRLQKIVEEIAIKNATFLAGGGFAGRPVAYTMPATPASAYGEIRSVSPVPPPPPFGAARPPGITGSQGPPGGPKPPKSPQDDLKTKMVEELNQLFESGIKLKSVGDAVKEEEVQKAVKLTQKAIEILGGDLAESLPVAKSAVLAILREKSENTGTLFVIAKSVLQELKKAIKVGTEDIETEADSLRLMAKQDPSFIKQELESKRGSAEFQEALDKVREPLVSVLKQIQKIRKLVE